MKVAVRGEVGELVSITPRSVDDSMMDTIGMIITKYNVSIWKRSNHMHEFRDVHASEIQFLKDDI